MAFIFGFAGTGIRTAQAAAKTPPEIEWEYSYGGSQEDEISAILQTKDGGYIFAGASASSDDDVIDHNISEQYWTRDYWIVKLDGNGSKQWTKSLGGTAWDSALDIVNPASGGYVITGFTASSNDVVGPSKGGNDAWVVRLDDNGESVWTGARSFGGARYDSLIAIVQAPEGEAYVDEEGHASDTFVLAGTSNSNTISGDSTGSVGDNQGSSDFWIYKLYEHGNHHHRMWTKTYGSPGYETARSIINAHGGGYIVGGTTNDTGSDYGDTDFWILKLDVNGDKVWEKKFGSAGTDIFGKLRATSDGGYILAASKVEEEEHDHDHDDGDEHDHGDVEIFDFWIIKLDKDGDIVWQKIYGDEDIDDTATDIRETEDGGYIVAGYHGNEDEDVNAYIMKLDAAGEMEWSKSIGGSLRDAANSIQQTTDGGYIFGGTSESSDGDVKVNKGALDCWVVKLALEEKTEEQEEEQEEEEEEEEEKEEEKDDEPVTPNRSGSSGCQSGALGVAGLSIFFVSKLKSRR
jgi:hypothetical protein